MKQKNSRRLLYVLFALFLANSLFLHVRGVIYHQDFNDISAFYTAAVLKHEGIHKIYDLAALNEVARERGIKGEVYHYLYPPLLAEILSPCTILSFRQFRLFWLVLGHLMLFLLLVVTVRVANDESGKPPGLVVVLVAMMTFVVFSAIEREFLYGQINLPLVVMIYSLILINHDRHYLVSGTMLAFCTMLKLGPILLIGYFLLARQYKAIFATLGFLILFAGSSIIIFGSQDWVIFLRDVLPSFTVQMYPSDMGQIATLDSPNYSMLRFFYLLSTGLGLPVDSVILIGGHKVFCLLLVGGYAYLVWSKRDDWRSSMIIVPLILTVMLLVTPILWHHHFLYILPGFVFAGCMMVRGRLARAETILLLGSFSLIALADYGPKLHLNPGNPLLILKVIKLYGLILYLWLFTSLLVKDKYARSVA